MNVSEQTQDEPLHYHLLVFKVSVCSEKYTLLHTHRYKAMCHADKFGKNLQI
jgi:hypothetical protein